LKDAPMSRLADVWRLDALYPHPERLVPFLGNHDTSRFISNPGATPDKMRLAFAVLLTMRGMPEVYSGDEIAMTGGDDPDNRHDFPGGWPRAKQDAFSSRTPAQATMHDWVEKLLTLRKEYPALEEGAMQVLAAQKDVLAYARVNPDQAQKLLIVVNRSAEPATVELQLNGTALANSTHAHALLGNANPQFEGSELRVEMPATSAWIATIQ